MFTKFIEKNGLVLEATNIPGRADQAASQWDKDAFHFSCVIKRKDAPQGREAGPSVPIQYSMGLGNVQQWAEKDRFCKQQAMRGGDSIAYAFKPNRTIHSERLRESILIRAKDRMKPDFSGLLESLQMDCSGVENTRTFEEWADEFGMDPDSRKGEKIYKACQETSANMARVLGESLYQEFLNVQEEED